MSECFLWIEASSDENLKEWLDLCPKVIVVAEKQMEPWQSLIETYKDGMEKVKAELKRRSVL